ncbi:hypothetical protein, partial [Ileibacterium valens]|uniref:hypothetical protein n=1 Tax=Ileibacterium valens TaxID=1862668 RepID=UPI0025737327
IRCLFLFLDCQKFNSPFLRVLKKIDRLFSIVHKKRSVGFGQYLLFVWRKGMDPGRNRQKALEYL